MTSARLPPAANLLRNSKLFALPAAVPLPPSKPTSEQVARSETATTPYPTRAAIYTSSAALANGDWGLKRALPRKPFTKTATPVIRLQGDIDTGEHIADFESAGDHVLTLQKWENTPIMIGNRTMQVHGKYHSVFAPEVDNTTVDSSTISTSRSTSATKHTAWDDVHRDAKSGKVAAPRGTVALPSLEQTLERYQKDWAAAELEAGRPALPSQQLSPVRTQPKRWRYRGPWLAGLSNLDFEEFMSKVDDSTIKAFREHLKTGILAERQKAHAALVDAAAANKTSLPDEPSTDISEADVDKRLQLLRHKPNDFGPEIASFFDLPHGPTEGANYRGHEYRYPPNTTEASETYQNYGLPRTHPSAGFSYLRSTRYANMDAQRGPMKPNRPLAARILKDMHNNPQEKHAVGVGGMVARIELSDARRNLDWQPFKGGKRLATTLKDAVVLTDGSLEIGVNVLGDATARLDENDVPQMTDEAPRSEPKAPQGLRQLPTLDSRLTLNRQARRELDREGLDYRRISQPSADPDHEINSLLEKRHREGV